MREIRYDGKIFASIKEFATAYNLPYQQTYNKLKRGLSLDQIVRGKNKSDSIQGVSYA